MLPISGESSLLRDRSGPHAAAGDGVPTHSVEESTRSDISEFRYLIAKIESAPFIDEPFRHVNVFDFFSAEHFARLIAEPQITRPCAATVEALIDDLTKQGYEPQPFPGCITSVDEYIRYIHDADAFNRELLEGYGRELLEGYGLTMRLRTYRSAFLRRLIEFLNGNEFLASLRAKFGVTGDATIETAIQKNLRGYEISPHCDTRRKALTYMVNIYSTDEAEQQAIHTHLLKFKPEYQYLYDFWRCNADVATCWVPWSWCETVKQTNRNNSIIIFRPSWDTVHAVKLHYDHLRYQRNQIYGNLWHTSTGEKYPVHYKQLDLLGPLQKPI